jgi:hypothetical protein
MTTDAIQEDVSIEETPQEQPVLSEREQAMQAIQQELAEHNGEPLPTALPVVEVPENPAAPEVPQEPTPAAAATPEKVRVKVDGVEQDVTLEELKKGYQKDSVASRRLEEAAQRQRDVERREAALAERERQIQASTATPSPEDEGDDDDIQAAIDALVDGDNETAAKLLKQAVKKGRAPAVATPAIDPDEIAARAEAAIEAKLTAKDNARQFQEFVAANPVFAEPTPDEEGNVLLSPQRVRGDYLFDNLYAPKWQAGEISYREALDKTAEHVAKEFAPVAPAPAIPTPSEREQRKAKIDTIPVAHGAKQVSAPKVQTPDEVLNEMRKARGQFV